MVQQNTEQGVQYDSALVVTVNLLVQQNTEQGVQYDADLVVTARKQVNSLVQPDINTTGKRFYPEKETLCSFEMVVTSYWTNRMPQSGPEPAQAYTLKDS